MSMKSIALATTMILGVAGPAIAAPSASLTTGGRTIAGPGKTSIAANATEVVYTHVGTNTNICTTVINGSRSSAVRITLVAPASDLATLDVAAGATGALCHDNTIRMDLTCLSPTTSCSAQWRVEDN